MLRSTTRDLLGRCMRASPGGAFHERCTRALVWIVDCPRNASRGDTLLGKDETSLRSTWGISWCFTVGLPVSFFYTDAERLITVSIGEIRAMLLHCGRIRYWSWEAWWCCLETCEWTLAEKRVLRLRHGIDYTS